MLRHRRLSHATAVALLLTVLSVASAILTDAATHGHSEAGQLRPGTLGAPAFDPMTTAYVVTSGAGGDLPGCGAISAIDTDSGEVLYRTPRLGSRRGLTASDDFTTFVAGAGAGSPRLTLLDARATLTTDWTAHEIWSPSGPYRIAGQEAVHIEGDDLLLGVSGAPEQGIGVGRVTLARFRDTTELQDVNPLSGFYSTRREYAAQIIPDPFGRYVHVLSRGHRTAADRTEVVESHNMRVHTLDPSIMAARMAPLDLPPLVVNEPPGAGLREVGVHTWSQNGRLAWATMLFAGGHIYGPEGRFVVVNRWLQPELVFADLWRNRRQDGVVTGTLPADFALAGAVAANHGWMNPGLVAVHGGDKIAVFDVGPWSGDIRERARLDITPVVSPITDDRRMMSGPLAWSADGSQLIAAGNEGSAEVLIIDVEDCGDRMTLRHTVTACPYTNYNGAGGFVTANGELPTPARMPEACPTPEWWQEELPVGSPFVLGLPWAGTGQRDPSRPLLARSERGRH